MLPSIYLVAAKSAAKNNIINIHVFVPSNKDYELRPITILLLIQHHLRHHERHHHHHEHQHKHKKTTTTTKNNNNNQHQLFIHLMDVMINDCGWSDGVME